MAITLDDAKRHLNKQGAADDDELDFFVSAANEWIANEVSDPTTVTAQLATRMLVAHWWETQRGPAGGPIDRNGGAEIRGRWYSIPDKVRDLIPELRHTTVTPTYEFPAAGGWPDPVAT